MAHGKLTLKKLKVHEDMSEETTCFSAELYEDGQLKAYVSNRGHGGCNDFRPAGNLTYKDVAHLENSDVEIEIDEIMNDMDVIKRHQSKALVMKKDGNYHKKKLKIYIAQIKKNPAQLFHLENIIKKEKAKGYEILNTNI
jgi:hypothetical protein